MPAAAKIALVFDGAIEAAADVVELDDVVADSAADRIRRGAQGRGLREVAESSDQHAVAIEQREVDAGQGRRGVGDARDHQQATVVEQARARKEGHAQFAFVVGADQRRLHVGDAKVAAPEQACAQDFAGLCLRRVDEAVGEIRDRLLLEIVHDRHVDHGLTQGRAGAQVQGGVVAGDDVDVGFGHSHRHASDPFEAQRHITQTPPLLSTTVEAHARARREVAFAHRRRSRDRPLTGDRRRRRPQRRRWRRRRRRRHKSSAADTHDRTGHAGPAGGDAHGAGQSARARDGRRRPFDDLDAFDLEQVEHVIDIEDVALAINDERHAVDDQGDAVLHAIQRVALAAGDAFADKAGLKGEGFADGAVAAAQQLVAGEHDGVGGGEFGKGRQRRRGSFTPGRVKGRVEGRLGGTSTASGDRRHGRQHTSAEQDFETQRHRSV